MSPSEKETPNKTQIETQAETEAETHAAGAGEKAEAALLANTARIVIAGLRNAGKSALMNQLLGRQASIVSEHSGATTDPVTRKMELPQLGAVAITDTAGLDDDEGAEHQAGIGSQRRQASLQQLAAADLIVFVSKASESPSKAEQLLIAELQALSVKQKNCLLAVATFADEKPCPEKLALLHQMNQGLPQPSGTNCWDKDGANWLLCIDNTSASGLNELKEYLGQLSVMLNLQESEPSVLDGLVRENDFVLLVAPVDLGAPKGRLINPQVETIRDCLDRDCSVMLVKERELYSTYQRLAAHFPPKLVITDSQAFAKVAADLPAEQALTSFSILFARKKGDLGQMVQGVLALEALPSEPRILMMEACSHHRQADDIGSVKIPRLLRQMLRPKAQFFFERSLPKDLSNYDLVIHCGGCMSTRRKLLNRFTLIGEAKIPLVNYGLFLGWVNGLLPRAIEPFADIYEQYRGELF